MINMIQEEKQLLLKDICPRLPYGLICQTNKGKGTLISVECSFGEDIVYVDFGYQQAEEFDLNEDDWVKPYLRPLSSMTDEERDEFRTVGGVMSHNVQNDTWAISAFTPEAYDWLNEHHFDWRGLIPMGLALEAPVDMYNLNVRKEENK